MPWRLMKRSWLFSLLIVSVAPVLVVGSQGTSSAWGCAPIGERRNVLYLYDQGSRSYVKFSQQRISATHSTGDQEQRWSWGANAITLDANNIAVYLEAGTAKARFKCKLRGVAS